MDDTDWDGITVETGNGKSIKGLHQDLMISSEND
jgi:hypothetical protein